MNSPLLDLWESLPPSDAELDELEQGVELTVELAADDNDDTQGDPVDDSQGHTTRADVAQLLAEAAQGAAASGVGLDDFMKSAWKAFLKVHPDVHENIERAALLKHLKMLRRAGKIGQA